MDFALNKSDINELLITAIIAISAFLAYRGHKSEYELKYSTFWPRLWAPSIDQLILWPISTLLPIWLVNFLESDPLQASLIIGSATLFYFLYSIVMHTLYGATIGKKVCKVRIVDAKNERPLKLRHALLRDVIPMLFICGFMITGALTIDSSDTPLMFWVSMVYLVWLLLEVVTMLFNERRRSLHDLIAGTIVVRSDLWETERARRREMRKERSFE
ncbi:MAG: RDD family protein [Opitutaceae bacterium]